MSITAWKPQRVGKAASEQRGERIQSHLSLPIGRRATNVATLPGIVRASYAMPDAHWGYGFPIGGVAAFDPDQGGVVSAGGVGCGTLLQIDGLAGSR
jgi:tRNA-splicing ligase RtcB